MYPVVASSACHMPPGGLSAALYVMEAVSVAKTINQPRRSSVIDPIALRGVEDEEENDRIARLRTGSREDVS